MNNCEQKIFDINSYDLILIDSNFDISINNTVVYHDNILLFDKHNHFSARNLIQSWLSSYHEIKNEIFVIGYCDLINSQNINNSSVILIVEDVPLSDIELKIALQNQISIVVAINCNVDKYLALGLNVLFLSKPWPFFYQYVKHTFCNHDYKILSIESSKMGVVGANLNDFDSCYIGNSFETSKNYENPSFSFLSMQEFYNFVHSN